MAVTENPPQPRERRKHAQIIHRRAFNRFGWAHAVCSPSTGGTSSPNPGKVTCQHCQAIAKRGTA